LTIAIFNLIVVLGIFEWAGQTTGNIPLARTMAVHTLVAAETFYLLSISQFIPSVFAHFQNPTNSIAYFPAIGVICVVMLQVFFSQLSLVNPLFDTYPLSLVQALICIGTGLPVVIPALFLDWWQKKRR
jgi:Ca2+-transporting ATPase